MRAARSTLTDRATRCMQDRERALAVISTTGAATAEWAADRLRPRPMARRRCPGGDQYNGSGRAGGGAIQLLVSGTLTNNGVISANGAGAANDAGAGAGGSI